MIVGGGAEVGLEVVFDKLVRFLPELYLYNNYNRLYRSTLFLSRTIF